MIAQYHHDSPVRLNGPFYRGQTIRPEADIRTSLGPTRILAIRLLSIRRCYLQVNVTVATVLFGHDLRISISTTRDCFSKDPQCSSANFDAISRTSVSPPREEDAVAETCIVLSGNRVTDEFQTHDVVKSAAISDRSPVFKVFFLDK